MKLPIKAKIYAATEGQTALKCFASVSIGGMFHINSYTISNTIGEPGKIYAFPPTRKTSKGSYAPYIEFPDGKNNEILVAIYKACMSAYEKYEDTHRLHEYGEVFEADLDMFTGSEWKQEQRYASKAKSYEKYGYTGEEGEIDWSDISF